MTVDNYAAVSKYPGYYARCGTGWAGATLTCYYTYASTNTSEYGLYYTIPVPLRPPMYYGISSSSDPSGMTGGAAAAYTHGRPRQCGAEAMNYSVHGDPSAVVRK